MELQTVMSIMERLETKLDDIRDSIQDINVKAAETMTKQAAHETEIASLKAEVKTLKSAHDRAVGALALVSVPGIMSFLYQMIK